MTVVRESVRLEPARVADAYPLTPLQQGMLYHAQAEGGTGTFQVQLWSRLSGPLDEAALREAWGWAVERHPALRTGFVWEGVPRPVQFVHRDASLPLETADWRGESPAGVERRLRALLEAEWARGFRLSAPPLLRLTLARTGDEEHLLVWTLHHLVVDGWSYTLVLRDVLGRYDALVGGAAYDPPAPRPYRDFVAWLRARDAAADEAYWRRALGGFAEPTPLGIDGTGSGSGEGERSRLLPPEATAAFRAAARARRVTPGTLVSAAWALLLSRCSGEEEVVFGVTSAGRPEALPGAEGTCGLFVVSPPLRVRVAGGAPLGEWLAEVQARQLSMREHEHASLVDVHGWSEVPRIRPLYESRVTYENFPRLDGARAGTGGLTVGRMEGRTRTGVALSLIVHPGERLHLRVYHDRARISERAAERLLEHLETVLAGFAAARPGARLEEIGMLAAREREALLGWSRGPAGFPPETALDLLEAGRARTPEATAVVCGGRTLSYAELHERADRLARHLRALGARPERRVGVCLERTPELIVALLAVVKTGAAYVPLDPAHPAERIDMVLGDARAELLVTDAQIARRLRLPHSLRVVRVDADAAAISAREAGPLGVRVDPENLAHVIYTSGSTGRPKGVMVRHGSVAALMRWMQGEFPLAPGERVVGSSSAAFDVSVAEIHFALCCGAGVVLVENALSLAEPGAMAGAVQASMVTGAAAELLRAGVLPGSLRRINFGGEALPAGLARALYEAGLPEVNELYGPTEDTTYSSCARVAPDTRRSTLGRPFAGRAAYVLDRRMGLVPAGVPGEIWLAGDGVARGYLDRPAMTAERFLPDPFSGRRGARMYRSGDRGRWTDRGTLEFLGRVDFQVKVRGFRIEPGEIEGVLQDAPGVREVVVAARADAAGEPRLVAYVSGGASGEECRAWLAERLPEYMVPAAVVALDTFPRTPNGKVDRRALPEPEWTAAAAFVAPRNATEELLAGLWAELLGVPRVGIHDDFFALGGHSLLAMQLAARMREKVGLELPLRAFLSAATIADSAAALEAAEPRLPIAARLAHAVAGLDDAEVRAALEAAGLPAAATDRARRRALLEHRLRGEGAEGGAAAILPRADDGPAPLTFAQERMWVLDQLAPGSPVYVISMAMRLRGELDPCRLRRAFDALVGRHEALRTVIRAGEAGPVQVLEPELPLDWEESDLAGAGEAALGGYLAAEAARPFDLAADAPLRVRLVRLGAREHALALFVHHAAADAWSLAILHRELGALYAALRRGDPSPLAPLPIRYADFAAWQRGPGREAVERQVAWWLRDLAGVPTLLELPADRRRPPVASHRGATLPVRLPAALVERLREVARAEGATLFMALLAGFQALLHRYTGETDFAVGTPVAGRSRPEVEGVVGLFVNTLVLRADLAGGPSFRELVARVRRRAVAAYAHQDAPFERLVEALVPHRTLSHEPLCQVVFGLHPAEDLRPRLEGVEVERIPVALTGARCDLTVLLGETGGGVEGLVEFAGDLFDAATVERMMEHLVALLSAGAAEPSLPVPRLGLLSRGERAALLRIGTRRPEEYEAVPVHALVSERARRAPEAVAVVCAGVETTYGALEAASSRLARHLRGLGVGPEARVGVSMERSSALLVAVLGVWKAGAAYVPVDPAYPADRRAYMLEDAGVRVVVADGASMEGLPPVGAEVVVLDGAAPGGDGCGEAPPPDAGVDALAYVIYTSGSTGRPKGVMVPHRGVANFLASMAREPGMGADDVLVAVTSLSFDIAVLELLLPLAVGARVVVATREEATDGARLARLLDAAGATAMQATPATWRMLLHAGWRGRREMAILCGGEALAPELARDLLPRGRSLWNLYGPTETTIWSAVHRVHAVERIALGAPVANTRLSVVDAAGEPAPAGVPGELWIGGDGVTRGYLGRPALTAERFVPDPFGAAGGRLYRTGDRVRRRADGSLEFLGRIDFQVKVRGFRIEPGEIEAVLAEQPGVREAAVVVREDAAGDARIVAYVAGQQAPSPEALRGALALRLPDYMLPSAFVPLAALPLTPNGKVDRRALPAPAVGAAPAGATAPRTPREAAIAGFWREALRVDEVGVEDDFFARGGHSLLATQVLVRIRGAFGAEVPLRDFFAAPTVAALAARVAADGGGRAVPPLVPRPPGTPPMLSFAQEQLWALEQIDPGTATYNLPVALRLTGALDAGTLRRVLAEIVRRHEGLRTRVVGVEGEPVAVVDPAFTVGLPVSDLRHLPSDVRDAEAMRRLEEDARRPFDLAEGPLVRAALYRTGDAEHLLLVCVHHLVFDGWSTATLVRELGSLYGAFAAGAPSPLPELPVQYADFAAWERGWLTEDVLEQQLAYWRDRLGGTAAVLELPTDRPRAADAPKRGAVLPVRIPAPLGAALAALGRSEGATPFMTLLAGYTALLHRYAGQDDVRVGAPVANRPCAEAEPLLGFFVNMLVLRSDLSSRPTFRELLRQVRDGTLAGLAHRDVPFQRLVEVLSPEREVGRIPLVQAALSLQNVPAATERAGGLGITAVPATTGTAKFNLHLSMHEGAEGLSGLLEYDAALFDRETAARLASHFLALLAAAAADPDRPVAALPLLDERERMLHLGTWSGSETPYPRDATIPELFEEVAAAAPDAVAVVGAGRRLTYAELNRSADRLARRLRSLGVGPDTLVGIAAERSPRLVVALLAILKAGGAYVPLDPGYPAARLASMLEDAGVRVLLLGEGISPPTAAGTVTVPLDADPDEGEGHPDGAPERSLGPSHLAYVVFTSGSTGRPKGVMVPHRAVVRLVRGTDYARFAADEVFLQYAPVAFDASTFEIWGPLLNGGRLVVAPPGPLTPAELGAAIREHGVTTLWLTAGLFNVMVEEQAEALRGLRQLLAGGDVLSVPHVRRVLDALPHVRLINGYGPTENTTFTCCAAVANGGVPDGPIPIGRPVANTRVYLLDAAMQPLPAGVRGELYAGGDGLARGYLNRPALTAERFVPDPFGAAGARLYRTGDLARFGADGVLEFGGRADQQVKLRGFRIEPGEVEAALCRHPGVRAAAVALRTIGGERVLAAYLLPEGDAPSADELREFLGGFLPAPMIPGAFVPLAALPLTRNGKVDRAALPAPAPAARAFAAPRDELERALARAWEEVLGTGPVGIDDGFFELGGNSLAAVRLIDRVQRLTGERLAVATVFREPTILRMAALLRGRTAGPAAPSLVGLRTRGMEPPLFCVHGGFGSVFCFAEVARHVERPFYGIQPRGFQDGAAPLERVEEMAAAHLEAVRAVQASGPYHLAGYCMGGMVALEMARLLADAGEEVALVAMLDTKGPAASAPHRALDMDDEAFLHWFAAALTHPATVEEAERAAAAAAAMERDARLGCVLERARAAGVLPPEVVDPEAVPGWLRVYRANLRAALSYRPRPYSGEVALLVAEVPPHPDPTLGWRGEAEGGFTVHRVPGNHESMLEAPQAAALARALESLIPRSAHLSPEPGTTP